MASLSDLLAEFFVDQVRAGLDGRVVVVGRCGDAPIALGNEFRCIYQYEPAKSLADYEVGLKRLGCEKSIAAKVVRIHTYGHDLPELGQGMTGLIELEGTNLADIQPDRVLGGIELE